jgi:preprotein translocase subunit YajC
MMFVTPAFAQGAAAGGEANFFMSIVPFLLIFVIMYFLVIRPQQKRLKAHRELTTTRS